MKALIPVSEERHLEGVVFSPSSPSRALHVLIVNCACGIDQAFYAPFAEYMCGLGFTVITYNYATKFDPFRSWTSAFASMGSNDFEAVLRWTQQHYAKHRISVIAHGSGGVICGFAPSVSCLSCMIHIGTQFYDHRKWFRPSSILRLVYRTYQKFHFISRRTFDNIISEGSYSTAYLKENHPVLRAKMVDPTVNILKRKGSENFNAFSGRLLSVMIQDDALASRPGIEHVHNLFCNAVKFIRVIHPEDVEQRHLGFFGFFLPHADASLWHMTSSYIRDNYIEKEKSLAEFDATHYPLVILRVSSRDPDEAMIIEHVETMVSFHKRGPVYLIIDLTNVHWGGQALTSIAKSYILKNADLIRKNHKGTAYIAPNFFIRKVITLFHKVELDSIIKPVTVHKNMEAALNWCNHQMNRDAARQIRL